MANKIQILEKIANTGSCDILSGNPCLVCPLAKLKMRPDGVGWLSCYEAITGPSFDKVIQKYKETARAKLIEIAIEEAISEVETVEQQPSKR